MEALQKLIQFCAEKKSAIGYSFLALVTIGGQQLFSIVAFKCPCNHQNLVYGAAFLFAPAIVLLIIGYFLNSRTWKFITGCCLNPKKMFPKGNRCYCLYVFIQLTLNASIGPIMWISIALLNGTFYACAMSGFQNPQYMQYLCKNKSEHCQTHLFKVTCGKGSPDSEEVILLLQAQSQILGWWLIVISAIVSLLSTCYTSCRSQVSFLQMTFWRIYIDKEKEKFDELAHEYATKLAIRNLRSFFEQKKPEAFDMPSNKSWDDVSTLYRFSSNEQYYSTLHRSVDNCNIDFPNENESTVDFVDGPQSRV
ncbi:calcium homeostasis modulator protein 5 [Bombina bombina]|nr:calcium homeostasis modulator protein 5 [Bombina bombina]